MTRYGRIRLGVALGLALVLGSSLPNADAALTHLADAASPAIGGAAHGNVAYLQTPTVLAVQTRGRARRLYAVPEGCVPRALTGEVAALTCPAGPGHPRAPVILQLREDRLQPVTVPEGRRISPRSLLASAGCLLTQAPFQTAFISPSA